MKYKRVQILPDINAQSWRVNFTTLDGEYEDAGCKPHPLGFMYYNKTMTDEEAFLKLKEAMIEHHKVEITKLLKSLGELRRVTKE